jgi:hypothetical protein
MKTTALPPGLLPQMSTYTLATDRRPALSQSF